MYSAHRLERRTWHLRRADSVVVRGSGKWAAGVKRHDVLVATIETRRVASYPVVMGADGSALQDIAGEKG